MNQNTRFWLLLLAALVLVVLIVGGSGGDGPPLDPRSVNPDGAKGVVESLERLGATVDLDKAVPGADATTALMLSDRLSDDDRDAMREWVRDGGVLIVADSSSSFAASRVGTTSNPGGFDSVPLVSRGTCTIEALAEAELLQARGGLHETGDAGSCFGDGNRAFIVAHTSGLGTVVTVGSRQLFLNADLDEQDAAVVALSLLAPNRSDAHVAFVSPSVVEFGEESLNDLIPPRVSNAILQLLAAFLLYGLYRGRRLGGVVPEPVPVRIEGSELVLKSGLLSERAKDPTSAAALIRDEFVQRNRRALSIAGTVDNAAVAQRVAAQTTRDQESVLSTLTRTVDTEDELVQVAREISDLDATLIGERQPSAGDRSHSASSNSEPDPDAGDADRGDSLLAAT